MNKNKKINLSVVAITVIAVAGASTYFLIGSPATNEPSAVWTAASRTNHGDRRHFNAINLNGPRPSNDAARQT